MRTKARGTVRVAFSLVGVLLPLVGLFVAGLFLAGSASAAPLSVALGGHHPGVVSHSGVTHSVNVALAAPTPTSGAAAPPGPNLNQGQQAADHALAQRRVILAVVAVVLCVIVFFGRRARSKHRVKLKNLQNAKS